MGRGYSLKQASFAGGVISPQALGRTDQNKYATGLRTLINAQVTRFGTVENRPGTAYCGSVRDIASAVRTVPFISFLGTSYVLEFGIDNFGGSFGTMSYMRPWKNGALIPLGSVPAWNSTTNYVAGNVVTFGGATYYCVTPNLFVTPGTGTFEWCPVSSTIVEIPLGVPKYTGGIYSVGQWVVYTSGTTATYMAAQTNNAMVPTTPGVWNVLTGYGTGLIPNATALASFQYVQQNDILTIAAQGMTPLQILHFSDTNWTYRQVAISVSSAPTNVFATAGSPSTVPATPTGLAVAGGFSSGNTDSYRVAAFNATGISPACAAAFNNFHQSDGGHAQTVTWTAVSGAAGYIVYRQQASGAFGACAIVESGTSYQDFGSAPASTFAQALNAPGGATSFVYVVTSIDGTTGVESVASTQATCTGGTPSSGNPNVITWNAVTGASKYNVYSVVGGVPGFIGFTANTQFNDTNFAPDTSKQPPINTQSLLTTVNDLPAVVSYYQQRLCFANTLNAPSTVWMSNVGAYTTFSVGIPAADSQYVSFTLAGVQVQPITALVDLGKLIVHTTNGEYVVTGNAFGTITPSAISVVNTGSAGSALIQPTVIGNTDLFVQYGATRLCDLRYEVQRFTFAGKDTTKFATDLFKGRTIVCTAYQKLPHSIVWCVLDNGTMVGLTYVSEDELYAWHLHSSTNGAFEQVACVIEGTQWALYAVVRRTINGSTVRYLERFSSRDCIDTVLLSDSVFLDASLTFDGRNTGSTTMTVTTGAGWTPSDTLTITASAGYFVSGDVGNRIVLQQKDATTGLVTAQAVFDIRGYTSATVVTAVAEQNVPTWAQNVATTRWGKAVKSFSGIGHLQGQSIGVLADGNVAADPLGPIGGITVQPGGTFTLTTPAMVVTAGLPIQTDVQTLPLENAQGESIQNKRIAVREATPVLYNSRGGSYGQDSAHLNPWKQPNPATGFPIAPYTGPVRIPVQGTPQTTGSVWMRHTEPTPWAMSGVIVTIEVGD